MKKTVKMLLLFVLLSDLTQNAESQIRKSQPQKGQNKNSQAQNLTAEQIAERFLPAVVLIVCDDGAGSISQGSGFFVNQGTILTNHHVIKGMVRGKAKIASGGKQAKHWLIDGVLWQDDRNDLAVLAIKETDKTVTPVLKLSPSDKTKIGEAVYVLSSPKGLTGTISQGIISSSSIRRINGIELLQIDAPISAGSSGGAVLNARGEIIGLATASLSDGQNLNFAIPTAQIKLFIEDYKAATLNKDYTYTRILYSPNKDVTNSWKYYAIRKTIPLPTTDASRKQIVQEETSENNTPHAVEAKPTLTETTEWLTNKLENTSLTVKSDYKIAITKLRFAQCEMGVEFLYINTKTDSSTLIQSTPNLKFLKYALDTKNSDGEDGVFLFFGKEIVENHFFYADGYSKFKTPYSTEEQRSEQIAILLNNKDIAKRVADAFARLKELCAENVKEPF